ncbi:DUF1549 and DUF1553 domain-containing protein [Rubripirellula amarantea]|nr:DUF1549 and DUF1553 domain-containing protein [Rubripirellula amarantea]
MKQAVKALVRWGWFGLLVFVAFGYLVAGLSKPSEKSNLSTVPSTAVGLSTAPDAAIGVGSPANTPSALSISQDAVVAASIARVNSAWQSELSEAGLTPALPADWLTVCRRTSLALVGSGLSLEEIRELQKVPEEQRTAIHLDNLLHDSRYHHYWGERWTRFLVGTDGGQFIAYRRRRFRSWLTSTFQENWSYDRLVRTLITAEGLWTDRPEVNFYTATYDSNDGNPDPVRLAARTSRAFLGLRIDCLQCHDDFLGNVSLGDIDDPREGLQTDFHQLAAFFTSAEANGLQGIRNDVVDYKYLYLDAEEEVEVQAGVPYQPELLPAEGDPRDRLATWITSPKNRQAARAGVSHVWALMFGRPIEESVDNLPLTAGSNPVLEGLTTHFIESNFDIRSLIRVIAGSNAFTVDSRLLDSEVTIEHESRGAVFPLVRLRPEQVASTVIQASRVKKTDRDSSFLLQLQTLIGNSDFVKRYGDVGEDEFDNESITISQRLLVMNGELTRDLIDFNPVMNVTAHAEMFSRDDQHLVENIYLSVLNRFPTPTESEHFVNRIDEAKERRTAVEDMVWVLLNSSELAWNH